MSKHKVIQALEQKQIKTNIADFAVGDTVSVKIRIIEEGGKERLQTFQGTVIARSGTGASETFSVHRIAYGEGMERVFYLHSPLVASIEVVRRGSVRRSKLYYLRGSSGKASKVKSRFSTTSSDSAEAASQQEFAADVSA
ncbi:MAG: 50S ribosomal protein L19 [Verrucomicrobia bacterium]|nr:50S ribosomal protein L19 [Verrucomicrobiota bacterium]MBS0637803.1 50S ribosomal protein L19 [Verrucomicrobiota bacterium]